MLTDRLADARCVTIFGNRKYCSCSATRGGSTAVEVHGFIDSVTCGDGLRWTFKEDAPGLRKKVEPHPCARRGASARLPAGLVWSALAGTHFPGRAPDGLTGRWPRQGRPSGVFRTGCATLEPIYRGGRAAWSVTRSSTLTQNCAKSGLGRAIVPLAPIAESTCGAPKSRCGL